jgi:hypothetical protein
MCHILGHSDLFSFPTKCIDVFRVILTTNNDRFLKQHYVTRVANEYEMCLLREV